MIVYTIFLIVCAFRQMFERWPIKQTVHVSVVSFRMIIACDNQILMFGVHCIFAAFFAFVIFIGHFRNNFHINLFSARNICDWKLFSTEFFLFYFLFNNFHRASPSINHFVAKALGTIFNISVVAVPFSRLLITFRFSQKLLDFRSLSVQLQSTIKPYTMIPFYPMI